MADTGVVPFRIEDPTRWRLGFVGLGWLLLGVANIGVGKMAYPAAVFAGCFSVVAAGFTWLMAVRPCHALAYRIGGTFAIGCLFLRLVTLAQIVLGLNDIGFWLALSAVGTTIILDAIYGHWWLTDVAAWHNAHVLRDERTMQEGPLPPRA